MRKALSFDINRKEIVDNVLKMGQEPAMAIIPPGMWKRLTGLFPDADARAARKELEIALRELKMTKEQLPKFNLIYNTNSGHHKIAQAIQGQWRSVLGIEVALNNMEWKVFLDQVRTHQFSIARMGALAGYNDPMTFFELYKYSASSDNYTQWHNPQFAALLEASDLTPDPKERIELLMKAERLMIDEMPVIPIYFYTAASLQSKALKGVRIDPLGQVDFKLAYLELP
jgi:oligopeptide transport system substrate-binding protein